MLPREKMVEVGASELSNSEIIAIILGSGVRKRSVFEISEQIDLILRSSSELPELETLKLLQGVGEVSAIRILACLELSRRYLLQPRTDSLRTPEMVVSQLQFIKYEKQEHFVCLTLDGSGAIINKHTISVGLVNQTQIHPREAFVKAIKDYAVSVVFAHNHPSGNVKPSADDLRITEQLLEAGSILGIHVLDHIIIARDSFLSLKASGLVRGWNK